MSSYSQNLVKLTCATLLLAVACSETKPSNPTPPGDAGVSQVDADKPIAPIVDGGGPSAETGARDASPEPLEPVVFAPCALYTEGGGPNAECATVKTPLDAMNPTGPKIDVFVKRFRPLGGKGLRALWLLQGGPGASGYVFERLSEQIATKFPDVDFYMPDHRGTGRSTRLGCPAQEAEASEGGIAITPEEWPTCLADVVAREGARLPYFNTTNAANDLGSMIERTKTPGQPTFVYGVSYGTYWAHRYLQLFPAQAQGVVLDSMAPPGSVLSDQDADANEAAKDFLDVCKSDAFCGQKLGADPWAKTNALFTKLKAGHCSEFALPDFPTHVLFRRTFGQLLMDSNLRPYIPAIIYRADRCAPKDVAALKVLVAKLTEEQPESYELKLWGWIVSNNILFSELWPTPAPSVDQLRAIREGAVASRDITEAFEPNFGKWPTYTPDSYVGNWATTDTPMLMLQGGLDPATLLRKAREMKPRFARPNQTWVEIPTTSPVDTTCVATVLPLDFRNSRTPYNMALFGTADAWE
jgi:pimeloyl-ACP methyl ester carboxylesterase